VHIRPSPTRWDSAAGGASSSHRRANRAAWPGRRDLSIVDDNLAADDHLT
jgi:hypothetical protein